MAKIKFNNQQQEAVDHLDGAMSVIASAGSGKTAVMIGRVEKLVREHRVFEHNILTVTFTRNSSNDLVRQLNNRGLHHVNVGTFHSVCGEILRKEGININPRNMIKEWQADNCFKKVDKSADTTDILNFISFQKNKMIDADGKFAKKDSIYSEQELRVFYKAYEDIKSKQKLYDFDDYLVLCLDIMKKSPNRYTFEYILVDEHQDSNAIQNELLSHWCKSGNLFVTGDYRQNLYAFRSSDNDYIMNMNKYWKDAQTMNIFINYRSVKNIVENANRFIKKYFSDFEYHTDAKAHNQENGHIEVNSYVSRACEGDGIADKIQKLISDGTQPKDIAVLYRNNKHADFVESQLKRRKIGYEIANDGSFFKRREVAGVLSILRLAKDNDDSNAFEGVFRLRVDPLKYFSNVILRDIQNSADEKDISLLSALSKTRYSQPWHMKNAATFQRYISRIQDMIYDKDLSDVIDEIVKLFNFHGMMNEKYTHRPEREERKESIETLKLFAKGSNLEEFLEFAYSDSGKKKETKENAVQLMTIHRSKGLEWDNVFVIGVEDGEFPSQREGAMNDIEEEARLMYVGITRSKENLWISEIGKDNQFIREYGEV